MGDGGAAGSARGDGDRASQVPGRGFGRSGAFDGDLSVMRGLAAASDADNLAVRERRPIELAVRLRACRSMLRLRTASTSSPAVGSACGPPNPYARVGARLSKRCEASGPGPHGWCLRRLAGDPYCGRGRIRLLGVTTCRAASPWRRRQRLPEESEDILTTTLRLATREPSWLVRHTFGFRVDDG